MEARLLVALLAARALGDAFDREPWTCATFLIPDGPLVMYTRRNPDPLELAH